MLNDSANILGIFLYVGVICYLAWKIMAYLMDKMFLLVLKYKLFRIGFFAGLALFFGAFGLFQMSEYFSGEDFEWSQILFLGVSAMLSYFGYHAYKDPNESYEE